MKILWLDDHIHRMSAYVTGLRELQNEVVECTDISGALAACNQNDFDVALIDLNLDGESGLEFLSIIALKNRNISLVVLSSFLYRKEYLDRISSIEHPILLLDKNLPLPYLPEFRTLFYAPIEDFHNDNNKKNLKQQLATESQFANENPFQISFKVWEEQPVLEQDRLHSMASTLSQDIQKTSFSEGAVWILLMKPSMDVIAKAYRKCDIWKLEDKIELAKRIGYIPYEFYRDDEIQRMRNPTVFIVHGHDEVVKYQVKNYLQNTLGLPEPVILHEQASFGKTIIEKFEDQASAADLVFVLLTPDDYFYEPGQSNEQSRRSRQNVIFEMGFFFGQLQRTSGRIILLYKGILELPSDISGLIYIDISSGVESAGEVIRKELVGFI